MLKIRDIQLDNPVVLAPMAGVTDAPFRKIVKGFHSGLVTGEMVSATALHYNGKKTYQLIEVSPEEHPVSMQIFGSDPAIMAEAARIVQEHGADIIDINMGCPVPKVVKNGEGAALLRNLPLAAAIIEAVGRSVQVPVTVKCRLGWDAEHLVAAELAKIAMECGAAAVTVHGRTRNQFYQGKADWEQIARVKQSVNIPVIGNGDVESPESARRLMEQTGCDGVMIGRAALGKPWLFAQVGHFLKTGQQLPEPTLEERFDIIKKHLHLQIAYAGEVRGVKEMRKHLAWYFKGLPGAAAMRDLVNSLSTLDQVERALSDYAKALKVRY